ncbi:hypothetical protein BN946_scf185042.g18 [Trametes cinnabarina]|uniref:DUF6535 domain-containing protein n=1 Tax=Pycnoporus cinnabarinus TaxID=5643 RepID=A0A060S4I7_PYCCI|nr:hypothetical protein BN946_scf185042.g18 [Trametes cinnabarina]
MASSYSDVNLQASAQGQSTSAPGVHEKQPDNWADCAKVVEDHHTALVKRWKSEIDTLLVYAGLFSAVLTAFNVELYKLLLPPDGPDATNALLAQIVAQLNTSTALMNGGQRFMPTSSSSNFHTATSSVWINSLWFSSIICSLSAASLGMMVKQWLHETELGLSGTSRDIARLRQYRLDSLQKWRVGDIVAILPVLLQIASALFLAGLIILLWTLHPVVASIASALVAVFTIFVLFTIFAPALSEDCAYRSFQSLLPFIAVQGVYRLVRFLIPACCRTARGKPQLEGHTSSAVWGSFRGWAGMEHVVVQKRVYDLDAHTVEQAHIITLDDAFTLETLRPYASSRPRRDITRFSDIHNLDQAVLAAIAQSLPDVDPDRELLIVIDVLSDYVKGGSCQGNPQLRLEAYACFIKTFGIVYLLSESHGAFMNDDSNRVQRLRRTFSDFTQDLERSTYWQTEILLSQPARMSRRLLAKVAARSGSAEIISNFDKVLEKAMGEALRPAIRSARLFKKVPLIGGIEPLQRGLAWCVYHIAEKRARTPHATASDVV